MTENTRARPARHVASLLELAERVHRGEITPEEAVQIFVRSRASGSVEPVA